MTFLVRKVSRAKWQFESTNQFDNPFDIPSDAVTSDLRSSRNTLSVWEVQNEDENNIRNAILAIVSAGDRIDTIDIVWVNKDELLTKEIVCEYTPGQTGIDSLIETHIDLSQLDYFKIGLIAETILDNIRNSRIRRYSRGQIRELLNSAREEGICTTSDFNERIASELGWI